IKLGDRRDGALAAAARIALLDADGRGYAGDEVHVRPGHLLDELPRVGVHRIEETALAFCKEQVERECAFARTADACDHNEPAAGDGDGKVFQIVFARAVNADGPGCCRETLVCVQHRRIDSTDHAFGKMTFLRVRLRSHLRTHWDHELRFPLSRPSATLSPALGGERAGRGGRSWEAPKPYLARIGTMNRSAPNVGQASRLPSERAS